MIKSDYTHFITRFIGNTLYMSNYNKQIEVNTITTWLNTSFGIKSAVFFSDKADYKLTSGTILTKELKSI